MERSAARWSSTGMFTSHTSASRPERSWRTPAVSDFPTMGIPALRICSSMLRSQRFAEYRTWWSARSSCSPKAGYHMPSGPRGCSEVRVLRCLEHHAAVLFQRGGGSQSSAVPSGILKRFIPQIRLPAYSRERETIMASPAVAYARDNQQRFVNELKDLLRIPSISTLEEHKSDVQKAAEFVA